MDSQEAEQLDLRDGLAVDACCSCRRYAAFADAAGISVVCTHDLISLPALRLRSGLINQRQRATALHVLSGLQLGRQRRQQLLEHEASQTLLAAAGSWHGTLVWVLEEAYSCAAAGSAAPAPLRLVVPCQEGAAAESEAAACEAVQLSSSGLLAAGHSSSSIVVWDLQQLEVVWRLEGHQGCVTALAFCPHQQQLLVSAGEDRTFKVWDLQAGQLLHDSAVIGAAVPSCLTVSPAGSTCLLCIGYTDASVRIFDLSQLPACHSKQVVDTSKVLQQVAAAATEAAAAFDRQQAVAGPRRITATATGLQQQLQQLVATTANDGSSSDTPAAALVASLQQDGAGCILAVQFVQLSTGTAASSAEDGSPRGTQLLQELLQPPPHLLVCARRGLLLVNLGSGEAEQCWLFGAEAGDTAASVTAAAEAGCLFSPFRVPAGSVSQLQQPAAQQLLQKQRQALSFRALPGLSAPAAACCFVAAAQQHWQQQHAADMLCLLATSSGSLITVARLTAAAEARGSSAESQQLSVFQTAPLPADSPLRVPGRSTAAGSDSSKLCSSSSSSSSSSTSSSTTSSSSTAGAAASGRATWSSHASPGQLASRPPAKPKTSSAKDSNKPKKPVPADKPVTFHKQIKSAGYGFLQPKVRLGQAKQAPIKLQPGCSKGSQLLARQLMVQGQYDQNSQPPAVHQPGMMSSSSAPETLPGAAAVHNGGILRVEFAGDGCRLLTGSSDHTARCLPLLAKHAGSGSTFVGHNGPITGLSVSHSGEHLLTSSADRTARLWSCSGSSPLITFSGLHQPAAAPAGSGGLTRAGISRSSSSSRSQARSASGPLNRSSSSSSGGSSSGGSGFLSEVTAARFFYLDELVLLATGNKLHMYRYQLAAAPVGDDILRLKSSGSYRLAGSYSSGGNSIADVAAANSFLSTLVLLGCSNRSIELVDAATLQVGRVISEAHSRPVTRLAQPPASPFASHPREACELFASAAPDSLVRLWDVRSARCVRSFSGHKHSSQQVPIGMAFSPCMRFLATGSEDKAAYLYDLRTGSLLHRLRPPPGQQADAVADIAFCPSRPLLVAACMNGQLCCYTDS